MEALFVPLSLLAGGLLAVQAGANTQLSKATGSPFAATTIQVVIAGGLLLVVAAATWTILSFGALPTVPWWHAIGGIATAIYVASTILLFPRLGAVMTVGLFIAGQMLVSLGLDIFGVLGVPRQSPDIATIVGTLAVVAGAAAIVFGQKGARRELSASKLGWILLALLAGAVLPIQGAINGLLRSDIGAPLWQALSVSRSPPWPWSWCCWRRSSCPTPRSRSSPGLRRCLGGDGSAPSAGRPT
jgi:bacterial/archaeal transporter family-2 protein